MRSYFFREQLLLAPFFYFAVSVLFALSYADTAKAEMFPGRSWLFIIVPIP